MRKVIDTSWFQVLVLFLFMLQAVLAVALEPRHQLIWLSTAILGIVWRVFVLMRWGSAAEDMATLQGSIASLEDT